MDNIKTVGILVNHNISSLDFASTVAPLIDEKIRDPNVRFLIPFKSSLVWKYFAIKQFRRCRIYANHDDVIPLLIRKMCYPVVRTTEASIWVEIEGVSDETIKI